MIHVDEAIPAALAIAKPGDVVLVLYEKVEPVLDLLERTGALRVAESAPTLRNDRSASLEELFGT